MTLRDQRQREFAELALNKKNGLLHVAARFGKIKLTFNFLKPEDKVLVIYPKKPIKLSWLTDAEKWEFDISNVKFTTTASLSKHIHDKYDWVIWDEPQEVLSPKVLSCIAALKKNNNIIGLSGSLSVKTQAKIQEWTGLEVIAEYSTSQAISEGIITDYQISVIKVPLDDSLISKYKWMTDTIEIYKQTMQYARQKQLALARMRLLHNSANKLSKAKNFVNKFKHERFIVFTHLTKFADSLEIPVYHSKNKDEQILDLFKEGHINHLATLDMISAGVTFKKINKALICTFTSNSEELYQRINRITSVEMDNPDKKAHVYVLCLKDTQEEVWLESALSMFDKEKIKYYDIKERNTNS
jgi:superfamily II DNA or RNA helicase